MMEEKGKTRDWLLDELRKNKADIKGSTENSFEILKTCSKNIVEKIFDTLKEEDIIVEDISSLTKTLHWFFTDIISSSDPTIQVKNQIRKITLLNAFIQKINIFQEMDRGSAYVQPTGDGMAIGFSDSPESPLLLAIKLHRLLHKYNKKKREKDKIHIRIGIDTGPVYFIKDIDGNDTVWGPGIIMARRVMDLCGQDQIFASRRIGDDISKLSPQYSTIMHKIGDYSIKHGEQLLIYNIYGKDFGNKFAPKKSKVIQKAIQQDILQTTPKFEFNRVELLLDVTDTKDMMTHHTWIWDVKNITKEPLSQIFYDIGGDIPKDIRDLNISIRDEEQNPIEIISLDVNKGHEKRFNARLDRPIKRNQKRILTLEYDWEEPYRVFEYFFSAKCKSFRYEFTAPKELQIKNRILEVERELGVKKRAEPAPKISYLKDKTKITWQTDKKRTIKKHETFEFQW